MPDGGGRPTGEPDRRSNDGRTFCDRSRLREKASPLYSQQYEIVDVVHVDKIFVYSDFLAQELVCYHETVFISSL